MDNLFSATAYYGDISPKVTINIPTVESLIADIIQNTPQLANISIAASTVADLNEQFVISNDLSQYVVSTALFINTSLVVNDSFFKLKLTDVPFTTVIYHNYSNEDFFETPDDYVVNL